LGIFRRVYTVWQVCTPGWGTTFLAPDASAAPFCSTYPRKTGGWSQMEKSIWSWHVIFWHFFSSIRNWCRPCGAPSPADVNCANPSVRYVPVCRRFCQISICRWNRLSTYCSTILRHFNTWAGQCAWPAGPIAIHSALHSAM
jgi:hypothetical protein